MLKNFNYPDEPEGEITIAKLDNPFEIDGRTIDSAVLCMDRNESERLQSELDDNTMVLLACKTPLYVNGVSPEFIDVIKEKIRIAFSIHGDNAGNRIQDGILCSKHFNHGGPN